MASCSNVQSVIIEYMSTEEFFVSKMFFMIIYLCPIENRCRDYII